MMFDVQNDANVFIKKIPKGYNDILHHIVIMMWCHGPVIVFIYHLDICMGCWHKLVDISVVIWYTHVLFTTTHTPFLCSSPCSLSRPVLWESTLLNCIPPPIDYFNGPPCSTVDFCVPAPHQAHTQSLRTKMKATSFFLNHVCFPDQRWQLLNTGIAGLL